MLSHSNSFSDREPAEYVVQVDEDDTLQEGDLDITETLFASLLTENPVDNFDMTSSSSVPIDNETDSENDEFCSYLATPVPKTEETKDSLLTCNPVVRLERLSDSAQKTDVSKQVTATSPVTNNYPTAYEQSLMYKKQKVRSAPPGQLASKIYISMQNRKRDTASSELSDDGEDGPSSKKICMSRNAVMARQNREKKKQYIKSLENKIEDLKHQNMDIDLKFQAKTKQCEALAKEVKYLRNVLANQSCISAVLKSIQLSKEIPFTSSLLNVSDKENVEASKKDVLKRKTSDINDNCDVTSKGVYVRATGSQKSSSNELEQPLSDYCIPPTPAASPEQLSDAGVCLHVSDNRVSLEVCSTCAENAGAAWNRAANRLEHRMDKSVSPRTK